MKVNQQQYRTVWFENSTLFLIEQNSLPFDFKIHESIDYRKTAEAIKTMLVRGAGAIGATAGFAMAQAFLEAKNTNLTSTFEEFVVKAREEIEASRPTAQNLFYATKRVFEAAIKMQSADLAISEAQAIADEDADFCRRIGEHGNKLITDGMGIATHCNAGWLAFVDYGSALSPIYEAHRKGKNIFVYVDETRPRGQGAKLTAWELQNENVPHLIIPDNATAYFMAQGKINLMLVGSDRIARNGDVANKIGTLEKAIIAKELGVPFYVAAPSSTIDWECSTGADIPIEERSQDEVLYQTGIDNEGIMRKIRVSAPFSQAANPAFDVTPAKYISGIITEKGIIRPNKSGVLEF